MVATVERTHRLALHPLHAVLLAGTVPLFLGALLSDLAYWNTYEIQWSNFASWLIAGALVFATVVVVWALVGFASSERRGGRSLPYLLVVLATWVLMSRHIRGLHIRAAGIPRRINVLMDRALLASYVEGSYTLDERIMAKAVQEIAG